MTSTDTKKPAGREGQWQAFKALLPHLWPVGQRELRFRVVVALFCLVISKVANVYVPILFKHMIDQLSLKPVAGVVPIAVVPVGLLLAYGIARVLSQSFAEL